MSDIPDFIKTALADRKQKHRFRKLSSIDKTHDGIIKSIDGADFMDFCSNDYLGLAHHPKVITQAKQYAEQYGAGSSASRLISGTLDIHLKLEQTLARKLSREAALIFNSGFQANSSILGTLTDRHSLILADKRSHNSLLQGSLHSRATFKRFNHNDADHLEALLKKAVQKNYSRIWIVTESIFSMDGDRSPLPKIANLSQRYDTFLFVDDAHAVGVWGEKGMGLANEVPEVDILLGTCGKAFGSFGAYVACSNDFKDYLINFCPGFIYTTALPPAVIGATQAALELIPTLDEERCVYHQNIIWLRKNMKILGFDTGPSSTQIIPLIVGDDQKALDLAEKLKGEGMLVTAIRPPTVAKGSARLRLALSSRHTKSDLEKLTNALEGWKREQD